MKNIFVIALLSAICHYSDAQNYVLSPLGIRFPNYSTATRPTANSLGAGTVLYNATDNVLQYSQGSSWLNLGLPNGLVNQTLRNNGNGWIADGLMQNDGSRILIGLSNNDYDGLLRVNVGDGNTGVFVSSTDNPGLYAQSNTSSAVSGFSTSGNAIYGQSTSGTGLAGVSTNGPGISAISTNGIGLSAYSATKQAIYATGVGYPAIYATSQNTGLLADGGYAGVQGNSVSGTGIIASSTNGIALTATSSNNIGIQVVTNLSTAIYGISTAASGLWGQSDSGFGVYATSGNSYGVYGYSQTNTGIKGFSGSSYGGEFSGRVRIEKGGNGDAGIDFTEDIGFSPRRGFIGMYGNAEMMVWGYAYNAPIQRWNINTGQICYATAPSICSDIRLKKEFKNLSNSLQSIEKLKGYHYYLRNEKNTNLQTGFIAQEIQKVFPELVSTGSDGYLSVDYIGLVPHLVESVKSLKSENDILKDRLLKIENFLQKSSLKLEAKR
ncbi:tail fiber domain-containing protein [Arcicella sp. LKC2W]|uniref:tail fiber domain-containing protein n=1 Tax=Arcicella sp. LKC2W TaxID=2984198 RepID=UPI002B220861|nr:tail fiber domain-containing protein [Arcicella sp. LKC2W]MEA5458619.1 tail fiber domain-containing protein [Arcicella sp. LKC2W]